MTLAINRRGFLTATAAAGLATVLPASAQSQAGPIDTGTSTWTPEYIERLAGTASFDTLAECARIVPLDYKGRLTYWYAGPTQASTQIEQQIDAQFWQAFAKTYPNIRVEKQNLDYNGMLNKLRTAALGNSAPMVAKLPIMWGVEFAAKEQLHPLRPEDVGYPSTDFWPAAMKSVTWQGKTYGVPTNNETMGLIWNAELFRRAGLNPEEPPPTWSDLREYSRLIKAKTRKNGYGMVARVNAGNTPFRYMPQCWAFGGGAL
ncbi:MAG: extracellular solute-binding protein, partial [Acetobacteraceae bacterium]|nr:extracellular solute-binding protein [Acetobacteraceae bacterium]